MERRSKVLLRCVVAAIVIAAAVAALTTHHLFAQQAVAGPISFSRTLYPIFEAAQCRGCHSEDGVASATRLHFPEPNASPEDVEAFGITLAVLVDRDEPGKSLLINKPTNRERHTGGERIHPGPFEEQALTEWVRHLATLPAESIAAAGDRLAAASAPAARDQLLRRLTHSQY